ncbi:hypothetical protein SmJEL517_g04575 [Synchytrium microbalum]|uniref:Protein kinase domain-containing protein n=1 Tax=Synchytrium microbalum TaxID=1806994 RepID=A0A507C2V9_9FUNG|nr:uncharacterized protein SmJEL517_g04575 [Synchytrium microbalum]TPX32286.1 hypothetical protein SmJEL517_g04575 [Synchytrium microbalum]
MANIPTLESFSPEKENIQPLAKGRRAATLSQLYTSSDATTLAAHLAEERLKYEHEITTQPDDVDDPLDIHHRYITWIQSTHTSSSPPELLKAVERAVRLFRKDGRYKNDIRYLKMWIMVAKQATDPKEVFKYLSVNEIGTGLAGYYEEYASLMESLGLWYNADEIYQLGVARRAEPADRLARKYRQFQERFERARERGVGASVLGDEFVTGGGTQSAMNEDAGRRALQARSGPAVVEQQPEPKSSSSGGSNKAPEKVPVYKQVDPPLSVMPTAASSNPWPEYGGRASLRKENEPQTTAWKGQILPQQSVGGAGKSKKAAAKEKFEVFRDDEANMIRVPSAPSQAPLKLKEGGATSGGSLSAASTGEMLAALDVTLSRPLPPPATSRPELTRNEHKVDVKDKGVKAPASQRYAFNMDLAHPPNSIEVSFEEMRAKLPKYQIIPSPTSLDDQTRCIKYDLTQTIPRKKSFAPSPTINTKEAFADVMNMWSQPLPDEELDARPDETISSKVFKREFVSGASLGVFHDDEDDDGDEVQELKGGEAKMTLMPQNDENAVVVRPSASKRSLGGSITKPLGDKLLGASPPRRSSPVMDDTTTNPFHERHTPSPSAESQPSSKLKLFAAFGSSSSVGIAAAGSDAAVANSGSKIKKRTALAPIVDSTSEELAPPPPQHSAALSTILPLAQSHRPLYTSTPAAHPYYSRPGAGRRFDILTPITDVSDEDRRSTMGTSTDDKTDRVFFDFPERTSRSYRSVDSRSTASSRSANTSLVVDHTHHTFDSRRIAGVHQSSPVTLAPGITGISSIASVDTESEEDGGEGDEDQEPDMDDTHHSKARPPTPLKARTPRSKARVVYPDLSNPCDMLLSETLAAMLSSASRPVDSIPGYYDCKSDRTHPQLISTILEASVQSKSSSGGHTVRGAVRQASRMRTNSRDSTIIPSGMDTSIVLPPYGTFSALKKLGEGGFGSVFMCRRIAPMPDSDEEPEIGSNDDEFCAIKVQKPANSWEFYILTILRERLHTRILKSIVTPLSLHLYPEESLLRLKLEPGTLLDVVNASKSEGYGTTDAGVDELLVGFWTIELLRTIEAMHSVGVIHNDIKPDNILVRFPMSASNNSDTVEWDARYHTDGSGGWSAHGITMADWGVAADIRGCVPHQRFTSCNSKRTGGGGGVKKHYGDSSYHCWEGRTGLGWRYEGDWYGAASVIHVLLFGRYMNVVEEDGDVDATSQIHDHQEWHDDEMSIIPGVHPWTSNINNSDGSGEDDSSERPPRIRILAPMKRYWQAHMWRRVFAVLLNSGAYNSVTTLSNDHVCDGDGESHQHQQLESEFPAIRHVRKLRGEVETWVAENSNRGGKSLRGTLKRVEMSLRPG